MKPLTFVLFALALAAPAHATSPSAATKVFDAQMQPIATEYLKIQTALAADKMDGVTDAATQIAALAAKVDASSVTGEHKKHLAAVPAKVVEGAKAVAAAKDIAGARTALKTLSRPMAMWATMSKPAGIDVVFCSMAKGSWLQKAGDVRNPYYGASMLNCGQVVAGENVGKKSGHEAHK
jgi:Cu(I)/Ag(I) efflux system membrane fusion protein